MQPISETFSLWRKYQNTKFQFLYSQSLSFSILEASNQAHTCDTGSYEVEWRTLRSLCVLVCDTKQQDAQLLLRQRDHVTNLR